MRSHFTCLPIALATSMLASLTTSHSRAEEAWGHLKGRFVLEGPVPAPRAINISGPNGRRIQLPDESLLVSPQNRASKTCLYICGRRRETKD